MEFTVVDKIWNRACLENGGSDPCDGDRSLADLLYFDSLVGNGGLGHGFDVCSSIEIQAAIKGFRYFGLTEIAEFLVETEKYSEDVQESLSVKYYKFSEMIFDTFAKYYPSNPKAFAPISD